jgi:hypothetical protein
MVRTILHLRSGTSLMNTKNKNSNKSSIIEGEFECKINSKEKALMMNPKKDYLKIN